MKNALLGDAKYRSIKISSEKFQKNIDHVGMLLLKSVGFEHIGENLVLTRDDPGLLILAKLLMEDSQLVTIAQN